MILGGYKVRQGSGLIGNNDEVIVVHEKWWKKYKEQSETMCGGDYKRISYWILIYCVYVYFLM